MLEKISGFLKAVMSKHLLRATLALATAVSLAVGYLTFDGSKVNADSVHVDTAFGDSHTELDSTDIAITDDEAEEIVDAEDVDDALVSKVLPSSNGAEPQQVIITKIKETVTETVKYSYKKVYTDKLYKGESKTTKGQNGEKQVVYMVTKINGVEVDREAISEVVLKEAVNQVETIGTKLRAETAVMTSDDVKCISELKPSKPIELDKNGRPVSYSKVITGKASAYCGCCDSNMTATGVVARPGYVAVNPKQIPYGTKLYIVSADGKRVYGYAIAADTGGFAYNGSGRVVDLRMPTGSKCNCGSSWGVRNVNIYVLK